jgi:hypothetical protein
MINKEMQLCRQFTMVKSQSGEILILISKKKSSAMSEKSNIQKNYFVLINQFLGRCWIQPKSRIAWLHLCGSFKYCRNLTKSMSWLAKQPGICFCLKLEKYF